MTSYQELLKDIALTDERFIVMTAENLASIRGIAGALGSRFVDTGIAEQSLVGMAAGLALRGRIPVVHALSTFLTMRAFEFIRTDVGIGNLTVKLCGGVPGFLSEANGPTHQALEDIALMRIIPSMNIFCPADEQELTLGLRQVLEHSGPFYIRLNHTKAVIEHDQDFKIGKAEVVFDGDDITILVYGMLFAEAVKARELLQTEGKNVRLLNMRTVKPVDEEAIIASARQTSLLVTLEDHFITGGLYSIVCEVLISRGINCKVLPIALENRWFKPALLPFVLEYEGFNGEKIAEKILKICQGGHQYATTSRINA
ncbi:MAG TPA: transketolase C-terminal domain-containing protein [Dissulfurispiraceae bacterium]|nr:transketolase C-terminal domain-containing protein [Dissulfurispiraceae bacterium]